MKKTKLGQGLKKSLKEMSDWLDEGRLLREEREKLDREMRRHTSGHRKIEHILFMHKRTGQLVECEVCLLSAYLQSSFDYNGLAIIDDYYFDDFILRMDLKNHKNWEFIGYV